jgi:oxygen-dependent protoporphyrinogen oxidase
MSRIAIIGGGISGLALAWRLQQRLPAAQVQVLEQSRRTGGKIGTEEHDGFRVETGPNGILDTRPAALNLCRELGLGDRLIAASAASSRNRFLFLRGRLRQFPSGPWSFLATDVIGWRSKLAVLLERFRRPRRGDADESVDDFLKRRFSREIASTLGDAFVTGIFAGDSRLLSVAAAFPRLVALEREHGSLLRGLAATARQRRAEAAATGQPTPRAGTMWSFREGLGVIVDALRGRLRTPPETDTLIQRVEPVRAEARSTWRLYAPDGRTWDADAVVLTCPAFEQARLLRERDSDLAAEIGGIAYNRIAVVALGYRASDVPVSLDGFGYLTPGRDRRDVLGVQWCSSIFPGRAPEGDVLLRALCGGWHRPEVVDWDDQRLLVAVRRELAQAVGVRAAPVFHRIVRWDRAIPQYHVGHLERVARIQARAAAHPGLFLGGNSYHGVAINDCVEQGAALADRVAAYLAPAFGT